MSLELSFNGFANAVSLLPPGVLTELTHARPVTCSEPQSKGGAVLGIGSQTYMTDP